MSDYIKCVIEVSPVEPEPDGNFKQDPDINILSKPPENTIHNGHPAFDNQVRAEVREAFRDAIPRHQQLGFLDKCEYPYQYPTIATVNWRPEYSQHELRKSIEPSDKFQEIMR